MKLYPVFVRLDGRAALVVGGGDVAARKCRALLDAGAHVTVGAPRLNAELSRLHAAGSIRRRAGRFDECWLDDAWLVVAATDDDEVNRRVSAAATARRLLVNVVDDAALSTFHVPAVIDRAPLQVAVSSGGAAPMLSGRVRELLEAVLDHALGPLAILLGRARRRIRGRLRESSARRAFYARVFDSGIVASLRSGRAHEAEQMLERLLHEAPTAPIGRVVLVGAGPGDPGLLTLNALRAINEADVVLHDRLVGAPVLELARRDAPRIEVGKRAGNHEVSQERIHALLLEHVRAGRRVVRLKGGDPFVFGRGGEEMEFLRAHGIDYEVVPGVTAALACAAYAGVPLTHRNHAQSVRFLTAHTREALDLLEWRSLAAPRQTLAVYMGVAGIGTLRSRLIAAGSAPETPVAIVENGTRPGQRVVLTTLDRLESSAARHAVIAPALLIIGEVAALAGRLGWFGGAPIADGEAEPAIRPERVAA